MRQAMTDKLLSQLNAKRGLVYPMIGYFYFVDLWGGRPRKVYQIIGENGGVAYARELNDSNPRKRCAKIRKAIENAN